MKLVFNWIKTRRKATYKLLQARTSYLQMQIYRCSIFIWCQECWCIFTEWPFQAFYQAVEVDSVLQLIVYNKVNFWQVYNKLDISWTFYKFLGIFSLLHDCSTNTKKFLVSSVKGLMHKKCFLYFQAISQLATWLCSVFNKLPSDLTCLQSPRRRETFHNFAYFGVIADSQFYALQLVYSFLK